MSTYAQGTNYLRDWHSRIKRVTARSRHWKQEKGHQPSLYATTGVCSAVI